MCTTALYMGNAFGSRNKCSVQTFMTEFSDLLDENIPTPDDLTITEYFNLHYHQANNTDVSRLRPLLHDKIVV